MKRSAKTIAICGVCGAMSCVALVLTGVLPYLALIFGVFASVATVVPLLVDDKNLGYCLLTYLATLAVAAVSGVFIGNIVAVAPVALFCVPFAIVKVWAESVRVTAVETLQDPFDDGDTKVMHVELKGQPRMPAFAKWLIYYALLEVGLALTFLVTWALTPAVFERLYSQPLVFWLIVAAAQVAVPLYDLLLRGSLIAAAKIVRKSLR